MTKSLARRRAAERGFTLVEMIVVTLLLLIAMLGLLAVFDASARINKSETDVADAQGAVRYGIYQMTRVIRMAGAGGLYVTEAVLNAKQANTTGITITGNGAFNNVPSGTKVKDTNGVDVIVRANTDMIEIRGVIQSPLLGFDGQTGCSAGCVNPGETIMVLPITANPLIGEHVNDNISQRPQFAAIDAYTSSISSSTNSMFVIVTQSDSNIHTGCSDTDPNGVQRYPQMKYNVGRLNAATRLQTAGTPPLDARVFSDAIDFSDTLATRLNNELPSSPNPLTPSPITGPRRVGVLDDILFFIAMLPVAQDPNGLHPYLAQGIRRGDQWEVTPLADDVEDLQVAYGVDTTGDGKVSRTDPPPYDTDPLNQDPNVSINAGDDEWSPNVLGETPYTDVDFQSDPNLADPINHTGVPPAAHCPRLHAVMLSLLAKAHDSDPTYKGPAASGYVLMDVPVSGGVPVTAVPGRYRRRVQTLRINLRNYAFQG